MKKPKMLSLLCALAIATLIITPLLHATPFTSALSILGITAGSAVGIARWLRNCPPFEPTIQSLNTLTMQLESNPNNIRIMPIEELVFNIHHQTIPPRVAVPLKDPNNALIVSRSGIYKDTNQSPSTVFIYSRGYAKTTDPGTNDNFIQRGGGATAAWWQFRDKIIKESPCITFDYPDNREHFNFGLNRDVECLEIIYYHTRNAYPDADIVLIGDCRGAKSALSFVTKQPKLKALVLMSPLGSVWEMSEQIAKNHLKNAPGSHRLLYGFFKSWFPSFDEQQDDHLADLANIPSELPILIGQRADDALISDESSRDLEQQLKQTNHPNTHLFIVKDTKYPHSRLHEAPEFQAIVNAFFREYDIPHYPELADKTAAFTPSHK